MKKIAYCLFLAILMASMILTSSCQDEISKKVISPPLTVTMIHHEGGYGYSPEDPSVMVPFFRVLLELHADRDVYFVKPNPHEPGWSQWVRILSNQKYPTTLKNDSVFFQVSSWHESLDEVFIPGSSNSLYFLSAGKSGTLEIEFKTTQKFIMGGSVALELIQVPFTTTIGGQTKKIQMNFQIPAGPYL